MRMSRVLGAPVLIAALTCTASFVEAQEELDAESRQAVVEGAQAEKVKTLQPYSVTGMERLMTRVEDILSYGTLRWHPFFQSAAHGSGLPLGVGYLQHVSPFNYVDIRGSYSSYQYKRIEAEFVAPRLFNRRGRLSVLGGWKNATQVNFYGVGPDSSLNNQSYYAFKEASASALLTVWPTRRYLMLRGGAEMARWSPDDARSFPSVAFKYSPATLPGLGATTTYVHTQATVGFDWRPAPGYAKRGGYYAVTAHDYRDRDDRFSFTQVDYEAVQHFPILRDTWIISLRALAETAFRADGQDIPYYLLPHLGGGSTLRGFESWRFRDRNRMLLQGEWRITANRFMETAAFYDAGKVTAHKDDLDFNNLEHDYGFGVRFHTPFLTALRVEVARSHEGTRLVVSTTPVF